MRVLGYLFYLQLAERHPVIKHATDWETEEALKTEKVEIPPYMKRGFQFPRQWHPGAFSGTRVRGRWGRIIPVPEDDQTLNTPTLQEKIEEWRERGFHVLTNP